MVDSTEAILGVDRRRFDPALLRATDDLASVLAVAIELQADRVEPSHVLVALSRIANGITARGLSQRRIPSEQFGELVHRNFAGSGGGTLPTSLDSNSVSDNTVQLLKAVAETADGDGLIGERQLLACTLTHLEGEVAQWLLQYCKIDPAAWAKDLIKPQVDPATVFAGPSGDLDLDVFSPGTRRVLATMAREAEGLGQSQLTTPLLLYAMAVLPAGLLEQALLFLDYDVRKLRERLFTLLGGRRGGKQAADGLRASVMEPALRLAFERGAAQAADEGISQIDERVLLDSLLASPTGLALAIFQDAQIDAMRVRGFAAKYYREPEPEPEVGAVAQSVEEALAELESTVVGQEAAMEQLRPCLRRLMRRIEFGYRRKERPAGVFLFCGPSGTGKTMTARVLAKILFGSDEEVLMFDMGQFSDRVSMNNFVGAPPGYVGFGQGKLTNGLRDNPRRVLLFDEVEKAHPEVFDALLLILAEGKVSDPAGPVRDAADSVIVLTSNLGATEFAAIPTPREPSEKQALRQKVREILLDATFGGPNGRKLFRPEFLNRIDEVVLFASFGHEQLLVVADAELRRQSDWVRQMLDVEVTWSPDVAIWAVDRAERWRKDEAARGISRTVEEALDELLEVMAEARSRGRSVTRAAIEVSDDAPVVRDRDEIPAGTS